MKHGLQDSQTNQKCRAQKAGFLQTFRHKKASSTTKSSKENLNRKMLGLSPRKQIDSSLNIV